MFNLLFPSISNADAAHTIDTLSLIHASYAIYILMPARLSSMELSDPVTSEADATSRRKSGRAKQKPVLYQQDPNISIVANGSGKRKRAEPVDIDVDADSAEEESSLEESDGDPDEEELKEKRRRLPKAKTSRARPAAKKAKSANNGTTKLAMRPAINGIKKAPKPKKPRVQQIALDDGEEDTGLYGNNEQFSFIFTQTMAN